MNLEKQLWQHYRGYFREYIQFNIIFFFLILSAMVINIISNGWSLFFGYTFVGMVLIITPILYENVIEWDGLTANNENTLKIEKEEVENVSVTLPKTT